MAEEETAAAGGADSPVPAGESPSTPAAKTPRRRGAAVSAKPLEGAAVEKPVRAARAGKKSEVEGESEVQEASKPRRSRVRAKAAQEETATSQTPKPRRIRARAGTAEEAAVEAPAELPAPKPSAAAAKKPAAGSSRRLVPGRGRASKDAPVRQPQLVHAHARYVRSSARKARIVCDHIRGKSVPEARAILAFAPRGVAKDWAKLLDSAVANAEHNHELIGDELRVKAVFADVGPTLKRFRPRAMGRATPINKRTAHLTITLAPKE
jgi:ribosomal protein L22